LKLEKTQKHAEDKKVSNQKRIEKLQLEYADMVVERRENDKQIEEVRQEANEVEMKVCSKTHCISNNSQQCCRCKNI